MLLAWSNKQSEYSQHSLHAIVERMLSEVHSTAVVAGIKLPPTAVTVIKNYEWPIQDHAHLDIWKIALTQSLQ